MTARASGRAVVPAAAGGTGGFPRSLLLLTHLVATLLLAGCASFEKKAPPEPAAPPPEEPVADGGAPEPGAKPAEPPPAEPARPPEPSRELPGHWISTSASGPGSAGVRRVEMEFRDGGAWHGWIIFEQDGREKSEALDGTWALAGDKVSVRFEDGRDTAWTLRWETGTLVLREGEAELRLERRADK